MSISQPKKQEQWITSPSHSLLSKRENDIYLLGKEKGAKEVIDKYNAIFSDNLSKSYIDTTEIISKIKESNLDVLSARLKVIHPNSLKVIITIPENQALSEKISGIYDFIYEIEEKHNNETYNVDYSILKANDCFDEKNVESDGFIFKHNLLLNEKGPRKTQHRPLQDNS